MEGAADCRRRHRWLYIRIGRRLIRIKWPLDIQNILDILIRFGILTPERVKLWQVHESPSWTGRSEPNLS